MEAVIRQAKIHKQLMNNYDNGAQLESGYDYERWTRKTEDLIKQHVSIDEAKRFREVVNQPYNVFRHSETTRISLFYDSIQAFLNSLIGGILSYEIEVNPLALQAKRKRVLYKLYDLAPHDKLGSVIVSDLATAVGMEYQETNRILEYWQRKGLVRDGGSDESVRLEPHAIDEIEESRRTGKETKHIPATTIYYTDNRINIAGHNSGQVMAGNEGVQTLSQPLAEILPQLSAFIESVRTATFLDRADAVHDLEKVYELAQKEQTEGTWKRIQTKLTAAKTTMEIAGYGYNSLPYWAAIWKFFFG
ncbi:MAG: hypothetical protein QOJ64_4573 [Acidobacteriota bacterium]|nr:hypothetical protein [Acidobacteriota bacterium]